MHVRTLLLIAAVSATFSAVSFGGEALSLQDVVENIRANERLYSDLDVRYGSEYRLQGEPRSPAILHRTDSTGWLVTQKGKSHLSYSQSQLLQDGQELDVETLQGFDGQTSRVVEQNAYVNIQKRPVNDHRMLRPHMLPISWPQDSWLLSDFVGAAFGPKQPIRWSVEEERQSTDGIECLILRGDYIIQGADGAEQISNRFRIWVSPERNYLPVRMEGYRRWAGPLIEDLPVSLFEVTKWKEIEPGVWFPMDAEETTYDAQILDEERIQKAEFTKRFTVSEVDLHPAYEDKFFSDIPFPENVPIYEVENGRIVSTRLNPGASNYIPASRLIWFAVANVLVIVAGGVWLIVRRSRRKA